MHRSHAVLALMLLAVPARAAAAPAKSARPAAAHVGTASGKKMVLPFVADDYTRAVAEARARKVPLFIEAWAPW